MAFVYFDLIKLAVPVSVRGESHSADAQYIAFGTYDMLHYALPGADDTSDLEWLERQHEDRHELDWNYERHPVDCYCPDASLVRARDVLDENKYPAQPLAITMVRICKHQLKSAQAGLRETLSCLQQQIDQLCVADAQMPVVACWNLGNADFLILSRPSRLSDLRGLYLRLNDQGLQIKDSLGKVATIGFASFSTYCAFPYIEADKTRLISSLQDWFDRDEGLGFINLVDARPAKRIVDAGLGECRFVFGDRDYQLFCQPNTAGAEKSTHSVGAIVEQMLKSECDSVIQSSSLLPYIPMAGSTAGLGSSDGFEASADIYGFTWGEIEGSRKSIVGILESIREFVQREDNACVYQQLTGDYSFQIKHCIHTLDALYKYAIRLYASAYQDDVFFIIEGLYKSFAQILNDSYKHMQGKSNDKMRMDNVVVLRDMIPKIYNQSMLFVAQLQHVFTVLAISPHSHMETYYGSMRSLNASSKLWSCYNGVVKAMCELFPTRNENEDQKCHVLLVPHREKYSHSRKLIQDIYSKSIVVLMEIDYRTMFKVQETSFIIAHELGHHIFNKTRESRFELMPRAAFATLFSNEFGDILKYPLYFLTCGFNERVLSQLTEYKQTVCDAMARTDDIEVLRNLLCLNVCANLDCNTYRKMHEELTKDLRKLYSVVIEKAIETLMGLYVEGYSAAINNSEKLKYYYGNDVNDQILGIIESYLSNEMAEVYSALEQANIGFLQNVSQYESKYGIEFDPHQIVKLQTYWAYPHDSLSMREHDNSDPSKALHFLLNTFREIHAEVFACKSIKYTIDKYLEHIAEYAKVSPKLLVHEENLCRIMVVCEAVFGDKGCRTLMEWIGDASACLFNSDVRGLALRKIASIYAEPYYKYMKKYGADVASSVQNKIDEIEKSSVQRGVLESVYEFARNENTAEHMWRFWLNVIR